MANPKYRVVDYNEQAEKIICEAQGAKAAIAEAIVQYLAVENSVTLTVERLNNSGEFELLTTFNTK